MSIVGPESIGFLIVDLARLFRQEFERAVAAEGLEVTAGEARTLLYVSLSEGIRQSALADRMRVEPMTLSNFLDRLEGRGLIRRRPDPRDRRAKQVTITAAAQPLVERIHALAARVRAHAARGLSPAEMETFRRTLQALRYNLTETGERDAA
ncbi:MAG: MarR family winged helix-turn-helix transcriptional regulator [Propylenella sp.]